MNSTASEVLRFAQENDVQFVRLGFCDPFGVQKNISIMSSELQDAFEEGVAFDASAIQGFRDITRSDLLLFPDPSTLTVLPWRPGPGRVLRFYCDIKTPEKEVFAHDSRHILKSVLEKVQKKGYICKVGAECEFYLFKADDNGKPTYDTLDDGGYLDIAPLDKGEDIRREICLNLEEMGLHPETSHHEQGPGQNEIDFKYSEALRCADNLLTFKSVVKAIAERNGLFAAFMPKPLSLHSGSGLHVNLSLNKNGLNIFDGKEGEFSKTAESFIAGILEKSAELTLFLNPIINSYARLGELSAPSYISWSHQNRSQLIRIPTASGNRMRMELRSPDPTINPYLAFALIIAAGLQGMEKNLALPAPVDADLYNAPPEVTNALAMLPQDIQEALSLAKKSAFVQDILGDSLLNAYLAVKEEEISQYNLAEDKQAFLTKRYFYVY